MRLLYLCIILGGFMGIRGKPRCCIVSRDIDWRNKFSVNLIVTPQSDQSALTDVLEAHGHAVQGTFELPCGLHMVIKSLRYFTRSGEQY